MNTEIGDKLDPVPDKLTYRLCSIGIVLVVGGILGTIVTLKNLVVANILCFIGVVGVSLLWLGLTRYNLLKWRHRRNIKKLRSAKVELTLAVTGITMLLLGMSLAYFKELNSFWILTPIFAIGLGLSITVIILQIFIKIKD